MKSSVTLFRSNRSTLGFRLPFLFCVLSMSACTTSFPPASFDWGHGAKPLEAKQSRTQTGGGAGIVPPLQLLLVDMDKNPQDQTPNLFMPLGIGVGGGTAVEYQVNESFLLRADAALGAEWSITSIIPSPILAGYVGTQLNLTPTLAARARLGIGGQLNGFVLPSGYVAGETGLVWSFLSTDDWEGWIYGYGMGRAGNGYWVTLGTNSGIPSPGLELIYLRSLGVGSSVGLSKRISETASWYLSGRTDMPVLLLDAAVVNGSSDTIPVPLPIMGLQAGVTWVF